MNSVPKRRSLTPSTPVTAVTTLGTGLGHGLRRRVERHETSERVTLVDDAGQTLEGWALNVSQRGVRAILDGRAELGATFAVRIGTPDTPATPVQRGRVVWVQDEPDGVVVGVEFVPGG